MTKVGTEVVRPIMALVVVAALGACAETKQVAMKESPPASAVLPEPALLQKGTSGEVSQVYLNPNVRWASYTKVMLDPVTVWTGPGPTWPKHRPRSRRRSPTRSTRSCTTRSPNAAKWSPSRRRGRCAGTSHWSMRRPRTRSRTRSRPTSPTSISWTSRPATRSTMAWRTGSARRPRKAMPGMRRPACCSGKERTSAPAPRPWTGIPSTPGTTSTTRSRRGPSSSPSGLTSWAPAVTRHDIGPGLCHEPVMDHALVGQSERGDHR